VIYGHEHHSFGNFRDRFKTALQRAEHATIRVRIHNEADLGPTLDTGLNLPGLVGQDDDGPDGRFRKQANEAIQESFAIPWK
jgi:hypothetical protein